jgi:hypothetical protein
VVVVVSGGATLWLCAATAALVWTVLVALLTRAERRVQLASRPTGVAMEVIAFDSTDDEIIIDGLLHRSDAPVGVPVTFRLVPPPERVEATALQALLRRWADRGASVDVDLTETASVVPTVALRAGGSSLRVELPS